MQIGEFSSFNPMTEFNKMSMQNGMELGKFGTLDENGVLKGQVSFDIPKISDMKLDAETISDLDALNVNKVASTGDVTSTDNFYKSLSHAINDGIQNVNNLQRSAEDAQEFFASGGNIDIHSVMIASQKAQMGLEMATQLRNKVISAYKEITRMQF